MIWWGKVVGLIVFQQTTGEKDEKEKKKGGKEGREKERERERGASIHRVQNRKEISTAKSVQLFPSLKNRIKGPELTKVSKLF